MDPRIIFTDKYYSFQSCPITNTPGKTRLVQDRYNVLKKVNLVIFQGTCIYTIKILVKKDRKQSAQLPYSWSDIFLRKQKSDDYSLAIINTLRETQDTVQSLKEARYNFKIAIT